MHFSGIIHFYAQKDPANGLAAMAGFESYFSLFHRNYAVKVRENPGCLLDSVPAMGAAN